MSDRLGEENLRAGLTVKQLAIIPLLLGLAGCGLTTRSSDKAELPGYLEADLVEMASPESGYLAELPVSRGQSVAAGALLFRLESMPVPLDRAAAGDRSAAADLRARDAGTGEREEVLRGLRANLAAGQAALDLARKELKRVQELVESKAVSEEKLDVAEATALEAGESVAALQAALDLAAKGQRPLQVEALAADASALRKAEDIAAWREAQLSRSALEKAVVQDTLYELGEWVPAGRPVVLLRRLTDMRARFFVSPADAAALHLGDEVEVRCPGDAGAVKAKIVRVSDQAEYTPPVIYSREQSARLVLMIEAQLPGEAAASLHPGLPVTVRLPAASE